MKSILQEDKCCYLCGCTYGLEKHHIFAGSNRRISERLGLWVYLCGAWTPKNCHTGTDGAQYNKELNLRLKREAQAAYERTHTRREWMEIIRKNYL